MTRLITLSKLLLVGKVKEGGCAGCLHMSRWNKVQRSKKLYIVNVTEESSWQECAAVNKILLQFFFLEGH